MQHCKCSNEIVYVKLMKCISDRLLDNLIVGNGRGGGWNLEIYRADFHKSNGDLLPSI